MVRIVIGLVVCISLFVSGCASHAAGISPIFTASSNYADWECDQIESEFESLRGEISSLETQQEKIYKSDKMYGWIGGLFLWPAWIMIDGDGPVAADLGEAQGKLKAVKEIKTKKQCK